MFKRILWSFMALSVSIFCIYILGSLPDKSLAQSSGNRAVISLVAFDDQEVKVEFSPPDEKRGVLEAELFQADGVQLAKITRKHDGRPFEVVFTAPVDKHDPANYYLK